MLYCAEAAELGRARTKGCHGQEGQRDLTGLRTELGGGLPHAVAELTDDLADTLTEGTAGSPSR